MAEKVHWRETAPTCRSTGDYPLLVTADHDTSGVIGDRERFESADTP